MTRPRGIVLLLLAGLNALLALAFTLPRGFQERNIASRVEALKIEAAGGRSEIATLRERQETIRADRRDVETFYKDVVKDPKQEMLPTIEYVEHTAAELGLTARARNYNQEQLKGLPVVRFSIAMPLSGPYRQIVSFLGRLEASKRFLVVDGIRLSVKNDVGGELALLLSAYFKREADEAGDGT